MKTITIGNHKVNFIDEIKTKHMRKLLPFIQKIEGNEIDMIIEIAKVLFLDLDGDKDVKKFEEFIDELYMEETTFLLKEISFIIEEGSKKKS